RLRAPTAGDGVPGLLDPRVRHLLTQQLPAAVESAAKLKERAADKADQLCNAACLYALGAGAALKSVADASDSEGGRAKRETGRRLRGSYLCSTTPSSPRSP